MPNILIGIPVIGSISPRVLRDLMSLPLQCSKLGKTYIGIAANILPYDAARNSILNAIYYDEVKFDYVLTVDADMTFPPDGVEKLYNALNSDPEAIVAVGHYYRRGHPFTCVWSKRVNDKKKMCMEANSGIHDIDMAGFGMTLIDANWVRENLKPPLCEYFIKKSGHTVLDDESFFLKIKKARKKILGVADVRCGHLLEAQILDDSNVKEIRRIHNAEHEDGRG